MKSTINSCNDLAGFLLSNGNFNTNIYNHRGLLALDEKRMVVANFNVVFGEKEEPLLNYFDTIVFPAFTSQFTRKKGDSDYIFLNTSIIEADKDDFVLTGIIVRETAIEIKSKFDKGKFINTDELHPTAPYSLFIIYLKNHRMVLVKNQKGSPDLRSFSATVKYFFKTFIRKENISRKESGMKPLPYPMINIVGIPMKSSIEEALKKVSRINKLRLKFYPLNGDIDFSGLFEGMTTDLRKTVGSKTGFIDLNTPTSTDGIIEILTAAQGTVNPVFSVTYPGKKSGVIRNREISESMSIGIDTGTTVTEAIKDIINKSKDLDSITTVSDGNQEIYAEHISMIQANIK